MYDFANILFSGRCSARCEFCIGRQVAPQLNQPNLHLFPLHNLEAFLDLILQHAIRQVALTGTNTDPQLYLHEERLLDVLRQRLPPETQISLHTNARQLLRKPEVFNRYDRATLSIPSFDPAVYRAMMGVARPPDLAEIVQQARIPLKVSCLVTPHNAPGLAGFLQRCQQIGVPRVVLEKSLEIHPPGWPGSTPRGLGLSPAALTVATQSTPWVRWKSPSGILTRRKARRSTCLPMDKSAQNITSPRHRSRISSSGIVTASPARPKWAKNQR